ncbi:phosphatase PAP2 family protein [Williamsia sterculiae]|uniref:PAP2 superfamily protein n=1 Tax=Williamsia sterculiae TaxID=1344003 RepID=A0A1N7GV78_9NOCA|nr:phosphatase PAP2 family protein [Williamsia sterculiae]SIS16464.1 PAP2 superfamily protein [Williamsia sterculiae]
MSAVLGRIAGSLALLAAMVGVYVFCVRTVRGQDLDERAFLTLRGTGAHNDLPSEVGLGSVTDPRLWLVAVAAIIVLGLLARRRLSIIALLVIPVVVILLARLLRDVVLLRPDLINSQFPDANTFPSGHAAAAAGCVAAIVRAAPRPLQPLIVAAGAMWLTLVSQDLMVWGWHRPSDLVGSILLAVAVVMVVPNSRTTLVGTPLHAITLAVVASLPPLAWSIYIGKPVVAAVGICAAAALSVLLLGTRTRRRAPEEFVPQTYPVHDEVYAR